MRSKGDPTGLLRYRELVRWALPLLCLLTLPVRAQVAPTGETEAPETPAEPLPVVAGPEGWLGTWRLLGEGAAPSRDGARPVVVGDTMPMIDPGEWTRGDRVWVGLELDAREETRLHLLLGMRGKVRVLLDGQELAALERWRLRSDDRHVEVPLARGHHSLALELGRPDEGAWRIMVRVLAANFRAGFGGVRAHVGPGDAPALARAAVRVDESHRLDDDLAPVAVWEVHRPAGGVAQPVEVVFGEGEDATRGTLRADAPTVTHRVPLPSRGPLRLPLMVGGEEREVGSLVTLDRPLLQAAAELGRALAGDVPDASRAPTQWRYEECLRAVRERESDRAWRNWLRQEARRVARELGRGRDPFLRPRGYVRMAHVSAIDGSAQPYELFVPPAYRARRDWPLVITLHGFKGNAGDYFRNTFGLARNWRGGETLEAHGRHGTAPTAGPMIVVAPQARGQSMYRHAGETDVLEVLRDVRARLRIDPRRIYITGGSMGGTGALFLPYRHPDLFAASAALAGYHDQRVRQDTHHAGLSDVERFLQAERSDIDWSENGLHLPSLLVRGTRDRPLDWTRTQVARLRALDYEVEHREPALGHNVWTETYAGGAIFEWFARHRRPAEPRHVRLWSGRERTRRAYWVTLDARSAPDLFARIDAHARTDHVELSVAGADGVTLEAPPGLDPRALEVRVDGATLRGPAPLSIRRRAGAWEVGRHEVAKQPGVSGPIRDVFHERVVFVVGTLDPDHTLMNRVTAEDWARPHGIDVRYPIVDDVDVTPEMIANATLVLVGGPWSNWLTARWHREFPIGFDRERRCFLLGDARHRGEQTGAVFVAPNPDVPGRSVLVIAGSTPLGTWRARFLPEMLADYAVFDARIENARGQWSCGGARRDDGSPNFAEPVDCAYRAHGFFDMNWRLRP